MDKWRYCGLPMIIAVDFDGTCIESNWPNAAPSMPGAIDTINKLLDLGHTIIIWTARNDMQTAEFGPDAGLARVRQWVLENFSETINGTVVPRERILINQSAPVPLAMIGETRKIFAHVYIDDRNLGGFPGWDRVLDMLGIS
jgi:hydroxymethylpyrimidine pyrophosphatase-like HAD family hydrolase